jgi:ABC-type branched-subunit amino acid transport system substrate-binding protein
MPNLNSFTQTAGTVASCKNKSQLTLAPILLVFLCLTFAACDQSREQVHTPGVTEDTILIGSSSALGGHASFLGSQYTLGSKAWFNEINAKGGVHGRKIQFLTYDDAYDPDRTVSNTKKLISDDQVFMLFDYVGTPTSVKIIDLIHETGTPAFGFFTGAEALRTPFRPNIFHVRASYYMEAEGAIEYFVDHLGFNKIAVMYQDDAFGLSVLEGVQLSLRKRGLEITATDTFARGSLELDRPTKSISSSNADAVILVGTYTPLAKFIKKIHQTGIFPYFHTVSFVGSEAFGKAILEEGVDPSHFERIIVTQVVPSPFSGELSTVVDYREHLAKHFPDETPNYVSLEGYTNARVLTQILQSAGRDLSRETLIRTFETTPNMSVGIGKPLSYGTFDHSGLNNIFYSRLDQDGHFKVFELTNENMQEPNGG